jgi:Outer membrane protein beta-barrel domain
MVRMRVGIVDFLRSTNMRRFVLKVAAAALASLPQVAAAQGFVSPFIGTTLTSPTPTGSSSKPGFGAALGTLGKIVGAEVEFAYYPEVLDNTANAISKNKVITVSGNTLIGPTIASVKAYGAVGLGNLNLNVTSLSSVLTPNPDSISANYFTVNVGGGAAVFFNSHFGARGDLRYYRAFGFKVTDLENAGLALDEFDFWRASIGLAIKF